MLIVSGRCCKCPTMIVNGTNVGDKYEELVLSTSEGSTITVGICRECVVDPGELPDLERAIFDSFLASGFKFGAAITGIVKRKSLPEVIAEIQASRCFRCDDELGPEWAITHGRAIHLVCKKDAAQSTETPSGEQGQQKTARKLISRGRQLAPKLEA